MSDPRLSSLCLILAGCLWAAPAAAVKLYKYVDEDGQVHYSDRVPPPQAQRGHAQLNPDGIIVNEVDRAKTAEEIARAQELERLRKEQQHLLDEQRAKDQVLLRTFRSEDDIVLARNGKLAAIDTMIEIGRSEIERKKRRLAQMQARAAAKERAGQPLPVNEKDDIERVRSLIEEDYAAILRREADQLTVTATHERDLQRFRELKNLRQGAPIPAPDRGGYHPLVETVVPCADTAECDQFWQRAVLYAKRHATTKLQIDGERILLTAPPENVTDIGVTVSRIRASDKIPERIFMDLVCDHSREGRRFCASEQVESIREGFRPQVSGKG